MQIIIVKRPLFLGEVECRYDTLTAVEPDNRIERSALHDNTFRSIADEFRAGECANLLAKLVIDGDIAVRKFCA